MVSHWSLSDSKSPQFSRTLLSILPELNKVVVGMVTTHPLISKSSSPCTNPVVTVLSAAIIIGITVTFMFYSFFNSLARFRYLSFFSLSFNFTLWSVGRAKSTIRQVLFFIYSLLLLLLLLFQFLWVFLNSISWWFFTGVWVTASLLRFLGLFSIFLPISAML